MSDINESQYDVLIEDGIKFMNDGNYCDALEYFEKVISEDKYNEPAIYFKCMCYLRMGEYDRFINEAMLSCSLQTPKTFMQNLFNMAENDINKINKVIIEKPNNPYLMMMRGFLRLFTLHNAEAIVDFDCALMMDPELADCYYGKAYGFYAIQRYNEAIALFDRFIAIKSDYASAYLYRAHSYYALEKYEDALGDYEKAVELYPDIIQGKSRLQLVQAILEERESISD